MRSAILATAGLFVLLNGGLSGVSHGHIVLGEKSYEVLNFFCIGPYGQKRVKHISQARKKLRDFI